MSERFRNPLFLAAAISFLYNVTNYVTQHFFNFTIDPITWLNFFNLLLWIVLGVGVWSDYSSKTSGQSMQLFQTITTPQIADVNPPIVNTSNASSSKQSSEEESTK